MGLGTEQWNWDTDLQRWGLWRLGGKTDEDIGERSHRDVGFLWVSVRLGVEGQEGDRTGWESRVG